VREIVESEHEYDVAINDYETMGWEVVERGDSRAVVKRDLRGSWLWHLLYFLTVPVIGNMVYSAYRRYDRPERRIIRLRTGG